VIDAAIVAATPPSQNGYGCFLGGAARAATVVVTTDDSDMMIAEGFRPGTVVKVSGLGEGWVETR